MIRHRILALLTLGCIAAAAPALAEPIIRNVPANKGGKIGVFGSTGADCKPMPGGASAVMRVKPDNGELMVRNTVGFPSYPADHPFARCNKVRSAQTEIWYNPKPDFRGTDVAIVEVKMPDGVTSRLEFQLNVN
jgi:hypothetical protein